MGRIDEKYHTPDIRYSIHAKKDKGMERRGGWKTRKLESVKGKGRRRRNVARKTNAAATDVYIHMYICQKHRKIYGTRFSIYFLLFAFSHAAATETIFHTVFVVVVVVCK